MDKEIIKSMTEENKTAIFDYNKFEEDVYLYVIKYIKKWSAEKTDIYALSINCADEVDSGIVINANTMSYFQKQLAKQGEEKDKDNYYYYKFCEEEWELWSEWNDAENRKMADYMKTYCNQLEEAYEDEWEIYDAKYEAHQVKIQEACIRALKKIRESEAYKMIPGAFLNFYIREKFSEEEKIEIIEKINGKDFCQDYIDYLNSFS